VLLVERVPLAGAARQDGTKQESIIWVQIFGRLLIIISKLMSIHYQF
jgi:hypothetical protein